MFQTIFPFIKIFGPEYSVEITQRNVILMGQFFTLIQILKVGRSADGWVAMYFFAEIFERGASSIISDGKLVGGNRPSKLRKPSEYQYLGF